jgi:hypothetical protein
MAVRFLVIIIPILNLLLLIAGLTVLPLNVGLAHQYLAAGLFGLMVFLALLFRPRRVPNHYGSWLLMLAGAYILGFLVTWIPLYLLKAGPREADVALAAEWWFLAEIVLLLLMKRYDSVRRGAFATALVSGLSCALLYAGFLGLLYFSATPIPAEQASFWTMEVIFSVLSLCWAAMLALAVGTWVAHLWCLAPLHRAAIQPQKIAEPEASTPALEAYARARAAFRTARLSLAVSASMISLVTVFLWAGAFSYANKSFNLLAGVTINYPPPPFYSITSLIVPTDSQARWLVRKADPDKVSSDEAHCGKNSPDQDNRCEAGTDAPAGGLPCANLSVDDQQILQHRLDKVQQVLVANGSLTSPTAGDTEPRVRNEDLESRLNALEEPAGLKPRPGYGCVILVYLLENKVGIAQHTEFHVLARALLLASTSSGLPLMIILVVVAIIVLGWAVARSLIPDGTALNLANNRQCMQLADWLSRGLDSTRAVTSLFWYSIFAVPLVFGFLDYLYSRGELDFYLAKHTPVANGLDFALAFSLSMLNLVGAKLALSGAAIAAIIYRYGRAPLDILLDVDNYLRTSPLDNAPRARIAERYVSLLRYIAAQKNPQGEPYYGSVVIVAHSLGALISADLLHFLKEEPDEALRSLGYGEKNQATAKIEIRLFTFGNPLRQLLNRFFPHIYWWVRDEPDNGARPVAKADDKLPHIADPNPDPAKESPNPRTPRVSDLGASVKLWFNAYRSGDFVGRMLWSDHWYSRNDQGADQGKYPQPVTIIVDAETPRRAEMCIGLGGHNDYWNRTAPDMAEQLDKLIQK